MTTAGLLLAAGAGRRMGRPKALVHDLDGTSWLERSIEVLRAGGCARVTVVLGAEAEQALALAAAADQVVVADDWAEGMGASLRTGLGALAAEPADADVKGIDAGIDTGIDTVLVSLVDLPDVGAEVVRRVLGAAGGATTLARASYAGVPGHPVLLGRDHWAGVAASATGDKGARDYLGAHQVTLVECGDLATGVDVDSR